MLEPMETRALRDTYLRNVLQLGQVIARLDLRTPIGHVTRVEADEFCVVRLFRTGTLATFRRSPGIYFASLCEGMAVTLLPDRQTVVSALD